jgi:predicted CXXCH cytochrome family protein
VSRPATAALCVGVAAALLFGCDARTRHKTLTMFFDGVPPMKETAPAPPPPDTSPAGAPPSRKLVYLEHGPYAAKLCSACHDAAAMNALVVPREELCFRCHEIKQDWRYVHGPLASGGCLVCHDPHSSPNGSLLVSESDSFCFRCHDRAAIEAIEGHGDAAASCTNCHDAHGSDTKFLLK